MLTTFSRTVAHHKAIPSKDMLNKEEYVIHSLEIGLCNCS